MTRLRSLLLPAFTGLLSSFAPTATGQVFLPDTNERTMLNSLIPGIVDANGVLDTLHPDIALLDSISYSENLTSDEIDFNGLRYLDSLVFLQLACSSSLDSGIDLTIGTLPSKLSWLQVYVSNGTIALPNLPNGLDWLNVIGSLNYSDTVTATIGTLPDSLQHMSLNGIYAFTWLSGGYVEHLGISYESFAPQELTLPPTSAGYLVFTDQYQRLDLSAAAVYRLSLYDQYNLDVVWPNEVDWIILGNSYYTSALPAWPAMLTTLDLAYSNIACIPWLPDGLETIWLSSNMDCVPNQPLSLATYLNQNGMPVDPGTIPLCSVLNSQCPGSNPGISGHILIDVNGNSQCDPGEPALPQASVTILPNGNVTGCDANGYWEIGVQPGDYTITPSSNYPYIQSISPTEHTASLPNMGDADTLNDFAVTLIPDIEDLRAHFWAEPARPGFNNRLYLTCQNYGTVPMDAQLTLEYDGEQTWVGSSTAPTTQSGNTATWQLGTLAIGASQQITVDLNTATTVPLGTPIDQTLSASPIAGDETPLNNIVVITDSVVGSYDPNDKRVRPEALPPAIVQAGATPIEYTIRFQNTGTFMAERVVIVDTLPAGLQPQSIEFLASSHSCHWYVLDGVLHFVHEGINLPDSTSDEPGSHGYVQFRILPDADLIDGETVTNIAHIVFDFNEPIITPPAVFSVDVEAGVEETPHNEVELYPNPVRDRLRVVVPTSASWTGRYSILDPTGRTVLVGRVSDQSSADVSALKDGAYVLRLLGQNASWSARFVKR